MEDKAVQCGAQMTISAGMAALSVYFGIIVIPLMILTITMIIDYGTGMAAAWKTAALSSKKGIAGIIKKLGCLVLVIIGMVVDWSVMYWLSTFGAGEVYQFSFGALVAFWLTMNELISILENLEALKVPIPKFLTKVVKRLKVTAEKAAEKTADTAEKESDKESEEKS